MTPGSLSGPEGDAVWDCHFHILDSAAPVVATSTLPNETASPDQYRQIAADHGLTHGVIVQPSIYGTDNHVTLRALDQIGRNARAICVVEPDTDIVILRDFHRRGVRGVRFNQVQIGATRTEDMPSMAKLIADLGWHLQLHIPAAALRDLMPMLRDLPVPVILDHIGRCRVDRPEDLSALLALYEAGQIWVKLSGPYHEGGGADAYQHSLRIARSLVAIDPTRLVWGSDWPHVTEDPKPPFSGLTRFIRDAAGDDATLRQIISLNPSRLYA